MSKNIKKSESLFQKRWKKFKTLKRGYYSFIGLIIFYILSFAFPLFINNSALIVSYKGELHFPIFGGYYTAKYFEMDGYGEANYRALQKKFEKDDNGNWVLMPFYPYSPTENLLGEIEGEPPTPPDSKHWFGTDNRGRDVFARLLYGFNISISFALVVAFFSYVIGIIVGGILGYYGGKVDILGQRLIEMTAGVPFLYAIMIITTIINPSFFLLAFLLIIFGWIGMTYYVRGEFYREKAKDYVAAAISMGATNRRVMFKHILPNSLTPIITFAPFAIVGYIFSLVSLDYLGFGLAPPTPSWGELLTQGKEDVTYWWLISAPLGAIFLTLLTITFIGEGVREAFDPKVHSRLR
ncbi:MAG: peptide ABC transporter permease [Candidatus Cloacimonadota bacterium]|nr:MAG: peptide ABC transporter permease [Candidatus Cloacimonadota bacterium]PIE78231.1 MAG: peptide ABC transporter permease [Candidatus Delongbacteria bacterium]